MDTPNTGELNATDTAIYNAAMASLYAKKALVMGLLDPVRKAGKNVTQGYAYMTASDVKQAVQSAMAEAGLSLSISLTDVEVKALEKGVRTIAKFAISICDGSTGASETSLWMGQGTDFGSDDKGFNKASTSALKYFLSATFLVSSEEECGHDADRDTPPANRNSARPQQASQRPQQAAPRTQTPSQTPTQAAPAQSQPQVPQNAANAVSEAQTPAQNDTPVLLSSTDEAKWPKFLSWNKEKLGLDERAVMVALSPVVKNGVFSGVREIAMAHVLAASAGYQASEIKSIGAELNLHPDNVIAEALLIAPVTA